MGELHTEWKGPLIVLGMIIIALAVAGGIWFFWFSGPSTEDIEDWAERDVTSYMRTDPKMSKFGLDVLAVNLLHSDGNKYEGLVTVETRRAPAPIVQ